MSETPTPSTDSVYARMTYAEIERELTAAQARVREIDDENGRLKAKLTAERARVDELIAERNVLYAAMKARDAVGKGDVWYWQGDGSDHPESFANNSHVVMTGAQAREFSAERAARERAEAELKENEAVINVWRGRTQRAEAERDALRAEAERLREALQWYADPDTWQDRLEGPHDNPERIVPAAEDCGSYARWVIESATASRQAAASAAKEAKE